MSVIKANNITNVAGGIPTVKSQQLIPTAWVNFNGESTVAIRDSENVSSITDNGTGDYTVNFAVNMPDVNYAVMGGTNDGGSSDRWQTFYPPAVGSIRTANKNSGAGSYDSVGIMGGVFR